MTDLEEIPEDDPTPLRFEPLPDIQQPPAQPPEDQKDTMAKVLHRVDPGSSGRRGGLDG